MRVPKLNLRAIFWAAFAFRFLSCIPLLIDEDEAWFLASARKLASPADFFRLAVDNKPPGTVWFYWLLRFGGPGDPRLVRAASIVLVALAALAVGKIAGKEKHWLAALLTFLGASAIVPQVLSTTNEGLMLPLIAGAVAFASNPWIAGALLGAAFIVKQTAVLFFLPVLLVQPLEPKRVAKLGAAFALVVTPIVAILGVHDFGYWTLSYALDTLSAARRSIFSPIDWISTVVIAGLSILPLVPMRRTENAYHRRLAYSWLAAGTIAIVLGHGLFFHYFLLLVPALALLAAWNLGSLAFQGWRAAWLSLAFVGTVLLGAWPRAGIFWGMDLSYHQELARRVRAIAHDDEAVWIWGGSVAPLALSDRSYPTAFMNSRYVMPPYTAPALRERFEREFPTELPRVIVDLRLRKDNRFDGKLEDYPALNALVQKHYRAIHDATLPWATFLVRGRDPDPGFLWQPGPWPEKAFDELWSLTLEAHRAFNPPETELLTRVMAGITPLPLADKTALEGAVKTAWLRSLDGESTADYSLYEQKALDLFSAKSLPTPLALQSRWFWATWAIVKLQPGSK